MSLQPPGGQQPTPGYSQLRIPRPGHTPGYSQPGHSQPGHAPATGFLVNSTPVQPMRQLKAPTLMEFWRSDSRVAPGRKPPKWAGRAAFWIGMLAAILYFAGLFFAAALLVALASPFSVVAIFFALIALIAGVGRGLGFFGLIFALAGSTLFWAWLPTIFG
jgi:hypothetical protein